MHPLRPPDAAAHDPTPRPGAPAAPRLLLGALALALLGVALAPPAASAEGPVASIDLTMPLDGDDVADLNALCATHRVHVLVLVPVPGAGPADPEDPARRFSLLYPCPAAATDPFACAGLAATPAWCRERLEISGGAVTLFVRTSTLKSAAPYLLLMGLALGGFGVWRSRRGGVARTLKGRGGGGGRKDAPAALKRARFTTVEAMGWRLTRVPEKAREDEDPAAPEDAALGHPRARR